MQPNRRDLLRTAAPLILPTAVLGQTNRGIPSPNNKLNIGFVGLGTYGARGLRELAAHHNIAAVCDVDWRPRTHIPDQGTTPVAVEVAAQYPKARKFDDWRIMLAEMQKDLDAVLVCTADHTHAIIALTAMKLGKHVYCEKPLAPAISEVRALMAAERKYPKLATQTGVQGHASEDVRRMVEWVRAGVIGDIKDIVIYQSPAPFLDIYYPLAAGPYYEPERHIGDNIPVPPEVKWDLWLGPAAKRPYNPMYLPRRWRRWVDFGGGLLGDHGPHFLDMPFWALDLGFPESIEADSDPDFDRKTSRMYPREATVRYQFPARGKRGAVTVTWNCFRTPPAPKGWPAGKPLPPGGGIITGTKGTIVYGQLWEGTPGAPKPGLVTLLPEELDKAFKRPDPTLSRPASHWLEWADAARNGTPGGAPFSYGGVLTQVCLLGDIALRSERKILRFDPKQQRFTNSPEANAMFQATYREGWTIPK